MRRGTDRFVQFRNREENHNDSQMSAMLVILRLVPSAYGLRAFHPKVALRFEDN
jgi:hypothetical protein